MEQELVVAAENEGTNKGEKVPPTKTPSKQKVVATNQRDEGEPRQHRKEETEQNPTGNEDKPAQPPETTEPRAQPQRRATPTKTAKENTTKTPISKTGKTTCTTTQKGHHSAPPKRLRRDTATETSHTEIPSHNNATGKTTKPHCDETGKTGCKAPPRRHYGTPPNQPRRDATTKGSQTNTGGRAKPTKTSSATATPLCSKKRKAERQHMEQKEAGNSAPPRRTNRSANKTNGHTGTGSGKEPTSAKKNTTKPPQSRKEKIPDTNKQHVTWAKKANLMRVHRAESSTYPPGKKKLRKKEKPANATTLEVFIWQHNQKARHHRLQKKWTTTSGKLAMAAAKMRALEKQEKL